MKRKGFTLIELLAVIVILAVIALITIPLIGNVIEDSRKKAFESSVYGIVEAANYYAIENDGVYEFIFDKNKKGVESKSEEQLNYKGSIEADGKLYIDNDGDISLCFTNEKYYAYKNYDSGIYIGNISDNTCTIGYDESINKYVAGDTVGLRSIEVNNNETIERGTSYTIQVTFNPTNADNQNVRYESSNTDIVEVDENGIVTAKANGEAVITVIPEANEELQKEITITVISPSEVTGISINTSEETIEVGDTYELVATLEPIDTTSTSITWESSDASIASVTEEGLVTGISVGEVIITARAVNGLEATANITVKNKCTADWCVWLRKVNISPVDYTGLNQVVNDEDIMNRLTTNTEAITYMVSSNNIMTSVVNSSVARRALFNNYSYTTSALANSTVAINAMKGSNRYKSKTLSCSWTSTNFPCINKVYVDTFVFEIRVVQVGSYGHNSIGFSAGTSSWLSCGGGQTCYPMFFAQYIQAGGEYYDAPSGTSTATFYYFEI